MLRSLVCVALFLPAALGAAQTTAPSQPPAPKATATVQEPAVPLEYERLDLTNGRKLRKVVIKSYDAQSGKLLLTAEGKATLIPIEFVPEPFRKMLIEHAPRGGSSTAVVPNQPLPMGTPAKASASSSRPRRQASSVPARTVVASPSVEAPAPAPIAASLEAHRHKALDRAERYYRYEYKAGSDAIRVMAVDFSSEEILAITGWERRYRTQGRALLEFWDSKGRSSARTTSTFEVITEQQPDGSVKVLDFTVKS